MRSMSKERGTRVKDRAENVAAKRGGKGVGKKGRKRLQPGGVGVGGYSIYPWVGRCGPTPHTLTDPDAGHFSHSSCDSPTHFPGFLSLYHDLSIVPSSGMRGEEIIKSHSAKELSFFSLLSFPPPSPLSSQNQMILSLAQRNPPAMDAILGQNWKSLMTISDECFFVQMLST